ncbi:MAG TPA: ATP-binding protein [Hyphomicrobiales bacterium]|nr:ATP-binding protein [Hyphomicrobiales bacterium]
MDMAFSAEHSAHSPVAAAPRGAAAAALPEAAVDLDRIRSDQLREIVYFTPMMLAASAFSSAILGWVVWPTADRLSLIAWLAVLWVLLARTLRSWFRHRNTEKRRASALLIRRVVAFSVVRGGVWAAVPILFFIGAEPGQQIAVLGVMVAMIFGGSMTLIRIPQASFAYAGLMLASLIAALFVEGGAAYTLLAVLCAGLGVIGYLGIKHHSRFAFQHSVVQQEVEHQREVIMLLLKDFEKGAGDWLWETDPQGRLSGVSASFANVAGIEPRHLIGRKLTDLNLGQETGEWRRLNTLIERRAAIKDVSVPVHLKNQQRWWTLSALPRFDDAQKFLGYRGVGRDVTIAREAEVTLKRAKEEAERANAAKSKFLAVLSHELRSPLNAVIGFSDIIAQQSFGPVKMPKYLEYAAEIRDSSRHLLAIIDDMLDIARIESGAVEINEEDFAADGLFESVRRLMEPLAEKRGIRLSYAKPEAEIELHADPRLVRQILINLVTNAVKFTPDGGEVALGTDIRSDGSAALWVRDTGIGIAAEHCERVFEPFTQVDSGLARNFEGVGLGLSIALHLARAHGGELDIDSIPGRGTTVRFTLPRWRVSKTARMVA